MHLDSLLLTSELPRREQTPGFGPHSRPQQHFSGQVNAGEGHGEEEQETELWPEQAPRDRGGKERTGAGRRKGKQGS